MIKSIEQHLINKFSSIKKKKPSQERVSAYNDQDSFQDITIKQDSDFNKLSFYTGQSM